MIFLMSLFSFLDGLFLIGAFAPFNIDYATFFLIAALLFVLFKLNEKQALIVGFFFGLGFFGAGISWVYTSIHVYGNASAPLAAFITFLLVVFLSLFPMTLCYVFRKFFKQYPSTLQALVIFPILWTVWELCRGSLLTGFPWLLIGYTQLGTPLSGLAPIVGVYGLSFLTIMLSGAIFLISEVKSLPVHLTALFLIIFFFGLGLSLDKHEWTHPVGTPMTVSLIQGNIPQEIKWSPNYVLQNINLYKNLTLENLNNKLIVWPEGAMPIYSSDADFFIQKLSELARNHHSNIIFGVPIKKGDKAYNGLMLIGDNSGEYLKRHLVPFGEYTPFKSIAQNIMGHFNIPMSDFDRGPQNQAPLRVNHLRIAPFICYEIIFPLRVWRASLDSNMLLNISDDSWFGKSLALYQQYQMAKMRSLETGRPQLIATNTGITAFISPLGKSIEIAPIDHQVVITQDIQPMEGKTPLLKIIAFFS